MKRHPVAARFLAVALLSLGAANASAQPLRKIGELELSVLGITAAPEQLNPVVPKNIATGLRVIVRGANGPITGDDLVRFLGAGVVVQAELSGPGLSAAVTLGERAPNDPPPADPLLLNVPPLTTAGDYSISNVRLVAGGRPVLDVTPSRVPLKVIEQALITSVKTRPLTLQEIKDKGIVLERTDVQAFEFALGIKLESKAINVTLPVVFDRDHALVPLPATRPSDLDRNSVPLPDLPLMIPTLLDLELGVSERPKIPMPDGSMQEVRIPALLVIPGNVGYLKQFFSAQLFVANGAPVGSSLTVRDVTGTIDLPDGVDVTPDTPDDPLSLPDTTRGPQPITQPVRGVGADGEPATADDVDTLNPGDQGQVEFLLRGEREGFHTIKFDIAATLDGLPTGPARVKGKASGGVLVRNPYFDMTFAVPSIVRKGERFKMTVTVTNIGQGIANDLTIGLDASRMNGATLVGDATRVIDTLRTGDAKSLTFEFISQKTGQVVAHYLRFDPGSQGNGDVFFTVGVDDRGVALSPDTFVLPAVVDTLPPPLVDAALRVLGQAWGVANAPAGTLPPGVLAISKTVVTQKAQALAEAGLRVTLGGSVADAVRDLGLDFYGGQKVDRGFDQLLRQSDAGREFAAALGVELQAPIASAGGLLLYQRELARLAASGFDQISVAVDASSATGPVELKLTDATGSVTRHTIAGTQPDGAGAVLSAAFVPIGGGRALALVMAPNAGPYTLTVETATPAPFDVAVAMPRGDGTVWRGWASGVVVGGSTPARLAIDPSRADALAVEQDTDGDGTFEATGTLASETLTPEGPQLVSASIVGPEAVESAGPFGYSLAILFDRPVDPATAGDVSHYQTPGNGLQNAQRQLSGRVVFGSFNQPEGPYVETELTASGVADRRGVSRVARTVTIRSLLKDIGAVVSGRVFKADGTPVVNGRVIYAQVPANLEGCSTFGAVGLSEVETDINGAYSFHFVRRDACGYPFQISTVDPTTGAVRSQNASVRAPGEQIVLDFALIGRGSVAGVVRDLAGHPVGGAKVVAFSVADTQSGGQGTTDGDGRYTITGITVGPVNVRAVKDASLGKSSGRIDRTGTTAVVDVVLDGGTVRVAGTVRRVDPSAGVIPVPGANVVYTVPQPGSSTYGAIAVVQTLVDGSYRFDGLPTGPYRIDVTLDNRDTGGISGVAVANDDLHGRDILIEGHDRVTVHGTVRMPDGTVPPAFPPIIVSIGSRGMILRADGTFDIEGVPVLPGVSQTVNARAQDGSRSAVSSITINDTSPQNVTLTLSGLGSAQFTLLDPAGQPVANQLVTLVVPCTSACGCALAFGQTNQNGIVTFQDVKLGTVKAQAIRVFASGFIDVANATAPVTGDGQTGFGVMRFAGKGAVTGTVLLPDGRPAFGADVTLTSNAYDHETCNLTVRESAHVRTDLNGHFVIPNVNVGKVGVSTTHAFLDTRVGAQGVLTHDGDSQDFTLRLVDTTAGQLSGTVYLPNGQSIAGAGIQVTLNGPLPDAMVTTDDQGHFAFAKIFPQGNYTLTARDPVTGGVVRESVYLRAGEDAVHDLRLHGRGVVRVRVVDGDGDAVENAFITLNEFGFPNSTYNGALQLSDNGVLTFDAVIEGGISVSVVDSHARGGRSSATVPLPDATGAITPIDVLVRLTVTGTVTGHFYRPDGVTPVPFGSIALYSGGSRKGQGSSAGSGDVGSYRFEYVPAGPIRIEAQDPLTGRTGIGVGTLTTDGETVELDVWAQGLGTVEGTVTSNGEPQPGAHVDVVSGSFSAATTTDSDGHYSMPGVPEGRVVVTANLGSGFLSGTASETLSGEASVIQVNVALRDSGSLTGSVFAAGGTSAAPPSVVTVTVGGTGGGTLTGSTGNNGEFSFERVPAGLATIKVDVLGSNDFGSGSAEVPAGGTAQTSITLNGLGKITGTVLDSAGLPIEANVTITGTGAAKYTLSAHSAPGTGTFHLDDVLAGPFTASLRVTVGTFSLYGTASGEVAPGGDTPLTIQLQESGIVKGFVVRSDGVTPALGTNVTIKLDQNRGSVTVQVQADGNFKAVGVPLGSFTLLLSDPLTTGVANLGTRTLVTNGQELYVGEFTLDDSPVAVVSIAPANGATGVALNTPIVVTLTDAVSSSSGIYVKDGVSFVSMSSSISSDGRTVTLTGALPNDRDLKVQVTTTLTDVFGRHPLQTVESLFHTVDVQPPAVTAIVPANGAIQVPVTTMVTATFSEPIAGANLASLFTIAGPSGAVSGTAVQSAPAQVVFTPAAPLAQGVTYSVTINGAVDQSGNTQTAAFHSTFATPDTTAPVITTILPADQSITSNGRPTFQIQYNDPVSGVDTATGHLTIDGVAVNPQVFSGFLTYNPPSNLADGLHTAQASIADRAGNLATVTWTVTIDTTPPTVPVLTGVTPGEIVIGSRTLTAAATDATTAVARYDVFLDNSSTLTITSPATSGVWNTTNLVEGAHTLKARAVDSANNVSAFSDPIPIVINNKAITVSITSPSANQRFRDQLSATATVSEVVDHLTFSAGTVTVPGVATNSTTYTATVPLATAPERNDVALTATAYGLLGEVETRTVLITVDRTPPAAPNGALIDAEPPVNGISLVIASAGTAEPGAAIAVTNTANNATATALVAGNGSFGFSINASADDVLRITAADIVGNVSAPTFVAVRQTPSLEPADGATSLTFEGLVADRVGLATSLEPDGQMDAVFTVNLQIGNGVTRVLQYIEITGPGTRGTRSGLNALTLGVAADVGSPLLNNPTNGTVAFPITSGGQLTLFASDGGFIQPGATYTVTVAFTDSSKFVGVFTNIAPEDRAQVAHSVDITASPLAGVAGIPSAPGTVTLTFSNIRDVDGTLVPDGAHVAIAVGNGATKTGRGGLVPSAGGAIVDGVPAGNNANFRVFPIQNGVVTATYSTASITPTQLSGALAVVQALAADSAGNVLGSEVIGSIDLHVHHPADLARGFAAPATLYADGADRRATVTFDVRDAAGNLVPNGTKVAVGVSSCATRVPGTNACLGSGSLGGQIIGGVPATNSTLFRVFSTSGGRISFEYSNAGLILTPPATDAAIIQVAQATAADAVVVGGSGLVFGIGSQIVTLLSAATSDSSTSSLMLPVVYPPRPPVQVLFHHVHDMRGNLVPDGALFRVSANQCATRFEGTNACVLSAGGTILDGQSTTTSGIRLFTLTNGQIVATYDSGSLVLFTYATDSATVQLAPATNTGAATASLERFVGRTTILLTGPADAVATVTPTALLADGGVHTATVSFSPILDAFGNPLPDGTLVLASAQQCGARFPGTNACVLSAGGQILEGTQSSNSLYKIFEVVDGGVTMTYANQNIAGTPGQVLTASVMLISSNASGTPLDSLVPELGHVPITLTSTSSANVAISPTTLYGDGGDRRATVTITNIKDSAGQPVPDGTKVVVTANNCAIRNPGTNACFSSAGGVIIGGEIVPSNTLLRAFPVQNGQIVFEYSAQVTPLTSGQATVTIAVTSARPDGTPIQSGTLTAIASGSLTLLAAGSASVAPASMNLVSDGFDRRTSIVISNLLESNGVTPIPDGARVGVAVANCAAREPGTNACVSSVGGTLLPAGVTAGDGTPAANNALFQLYTVAGGQIQLTYSDLGIATGVNQTQVARIVVAPASAQGNVPAGTITSIGTGTINLRGVTSATASGPSSVSRQAGPVIVTFSGIKDSGGNIVPDGTLIAVNAANNATRDFNTNAFNPSTGGTINNGTPSLTGNGWKIFSVTNGSISVEYSPTTAATGTARIQITQAQADGSITGSTVYALFGGVWPITIQP